MIPSATVDYHKDWCNMVAYQKRKNQPYPTYEVYRAAQEKLRYPERHR